MKQSFVKISKITEPPYSDIWVYPKGTKAQIKSRIKELKSLGVESVSFQGELQVGTISILGKGYVGIVVLGKIQSLQKRKHDDVKLFLRDILKDNLKNSGIPKGLEKDFKKGVKIIDASKVSTKSIKEAITNIAVTDETVFR